jgi:hypothetical protein
MLLKYMQFVPEPEIWHNIATEKQKYWPCFVGSELDEYETKRAAYYKAMLRDKNYRT